MNEWEKRQKEDKAILRKAHEGVLGAIKLSRHRAIFANIGSDRFPKKVFVRPGLKKDMNDRFVFVQYKVSAVGRRPCATLSFSYGWKMRNQYVRWSECDQAWYDAVADAIEMALQQQEAILMERAEAQKLSQRREHVAGRDVKALLEGSGLTFSKGWSSSKNPCKSFNVYEDGVPPGQRTYFFSVEYSFEDKTDKITERHISLLSKFRLTQASLKAALFLAKLMPKDDPTA